MENQDASKNHRLDIIIPSLRPLEIDFLSLLKLEVPPGFLVHIIVVIDIPGQVGFDHIIDDSRRITVITNGSNIGAPRSRNAGLECSDGDLVLFLDDDIIPESDILKAYVEAIEMHPTSIGAIGITDFPPPINSFTSGVVVSDILTFFRIARTREWFSWGTTSNLLLKREFIGKNRFSTFFPKGGGGEDIDFCLRVREGKPQSYCTAPRARVLHNWWQNGDRSYGRFFRWAYGDSRLPKLHPEYSYMNFPNLVEFTVLFFPFYLILFALCFTGVFNILVFFALAVSFEFCVETERVKHLRPNARIIHACESTLVRLSNDLGRLVGNFSRGHFLSIGERFDYFTSGESKQFERMIASIKFTLYLIAASIALLFAL